MLLASRSRDLWNLWGGRSSPPVLAAPSASEDAAATREAIGVLEETVRRDPEDALAYNKLTGYYHHLLRETGALQYLELSLRAAHASLASVPVLRNTGGLSALALAEFSSHDFAQARDHARQLAEIDPTRAYPREMLGDALLELGDYGQAEQAYKEMQRRSGGVDENAESRMARVALLRGDNAGARRHFSNALALQRNVFEPSRELIAWYQWQIGETDFAVGDYPAAEAEYRGALTTFPGYYRALASLGRVLAARGDYSEAIEEYQAAIRVLPDPMFVAALGDLYELSGRQDEAQAQYDLVEVIGHLSVLAGVLYNRPLALFYADHDVKAERAYVSAEREFAIRHDIYGADAVAWTAFKAGKVRRAQVAMRAALRLGTQDARLFYHAGLIARAAGDQELARTYLQRALNLNRQFDPLQVTKARQALDELNRRPATSVSCTPPATSENRPAAQLLLV